MSSIGQGVGPNYLQQMMQWQAMQQAQNPSMQGNPALSSTTPFTQPPQAMGTTLNSMGSPAVRPSMPPGNINPPQGANAGGLPNPFAGGNMFGKGIGQLAGALAPRTSAPQPMQVPNLQVHGAGNMANPQMLQQMLASGQFRGPQSQGGMWQNTQGQGYA